MCAYVCLVNAKNMSKAKLINFDSTGVVVVPLWCRHVQAGMTRNTLSMLAHHSNRTDAAHP